MCAAGALLALLALQCGGDGSARDRGDLPLPERADLVDAGTNDTSTASSPLDSSVIEPLAPACDVAKPFGAPVRLPELDAAAARSTPRLSADELSLYFTSHGATTGSDLSVAVRPSTSAPFADEKPLLQSTAANDNDPSVGADHLTLWFHSARNGSADIFSATRASTDVGFGVAAPIAAVNQEATNENQAYFRLGGDELWFISDRPGGAGGYDIYVSTRSAGVFAAPSRVSELSSPSADWQPQPSEDGLTILFASDRAGGAGKLDLWVARRASTSVPFEAPVPLAEINSPAVEQAGWLSADGCRIWFSSGRETADDHPQLFFAQRPR